MVHFKQIIIISAESIVTSILTQFYIEHLWCSMEI